MRSCIYSGSFDPFHNGHLNIVKRAAAIFDTVYVLVASSPKKKYTLNEHERWRVATYTCGNIPNVKVQILQAGHLVGDFAANHKVKTIVKGIRNLQDTEYEKMLHEITVSLEMGMDTVVMYATPEDQKMSSSAVKELLYYNEDVTSYVPLATKHLMEVRQNKQIIIGLTGTIGAGKSYVAHVLGGSGFPSCLFDDEEHKCSWDIENTIWRVDTDQLVSNITYGTTANQERLDIRKQLEDWLGVPLEVDGEPNRKEVAHRLFSDHDLLQKVNALYKPVIIRAIRQLISGRKGIIVLESPLLIDLGLTSLCNNRVALLDVPFQVLFDRLVERYEGDREEVQLRLTAQMGTEEKKSVLQDTIAAAGYGEMILLDNTPESPLFKGSLSEKQAYLRNKLYPMVSTWMGETL